MPLLPEPRKKKMSAYDVFATMANHMLTQKVRAEDNNFTLYHCDDGRKCPIGIFMAPEYADAVEGIPVDDESVLWSLNIETTPEIEKILSAMQRIHDDVPVEVWNGAINVLARKFGFKPKKRAPR